ncbi:MAG: helix-turn-helix domain-containing protein [Clostridiales bacterium]|nr:helix-turn-helix domain-containing protein [Clostridiales bacterium]
MFFERLKAARKRAGFTQQQAAESLNLSTRSYQRYEAVAGQCDPPIETLVQMADLFDVSIDWLLGRDDWLKSHGVHADESP